MLLGFGQFYTCLLQLILFFLSVDGNYLMPSEAVAVDKQKRLPKAIIVGVKKAGTRALLEFLRLNPAIKAPGPEVHFFDKNYDKGCEWYRSQMPETTSSQMTLEKSPAYFISKTAPQRVYEFNPAMKLIVVVRNPVTRAISDKRKTVNSSWGAIRIGVYHEYIKKWLKYFPLHQIHFVDGERLIRNPAAEVRAAEVFLGFRPTVDPSDFAVDPIKKFPCVLRHNNTLHCLGKTKGRPHPFVDPSVIDALRQYYAEENEKFFRLINRRFNW